MVDFEVGSPNSISWLLERSKRQASRFWVLVVDCCFDLCGTPDLESMIAFCEVFYDWLALDPRHTILFHAESAAALQRLLILLYSYACFCDSMER
nr:unnamed protein product [Spirometra erinaceieuropaei]